MNVNLYSVSHEGKATLSGYVLLVKIKKLMCTKISMEARCCRVTALPVVILTQSNYYIGYDCFVLNESRISLNCTRFQFTLITYIFSQIKSIKVFYKIVCV